MLLFQCSITRRPSLLAILIRPTSTVLQKSDPGHLACARTILGGSAHSLRRGVARRLFLSSFTLEFLMAWIQRTLHSARPRGFHLITREVVEALPELENLSVGVLHLFLQHTSASLSINENADSDVPLDLETSLSAIAPEDFPHRHTCEGPDDMPAHVKSSLLGCSLSIPIQNGRLCLGTWQGIYLCEHRNHGGSRRLVATLWGE